MSDKGNPRFCCWPGFGQWLNIPIYSCCYYSNSQSTDEPFPFVGLIHKEIYNFECYLPTTIVANNMLLHDPYCGLEPTSNQGSFVILILVQMDFT
jgi:hypothetical protein